MGLEIKLLGPAAVEAGGTPVAITGRRRVGVLARLALDAGRAVAAESLLTDVWAGSSAATAGKQLHIVVSKLRETLAAHGAAEAIETVPGGYRLAIDRDQVDVHAFAHLAAQARAAWADGAAATADVLFRRALELWRGPALAELDAHWAVIEAERLEVERLAVLEDHAELRLATGDHRALAADLIAHVREHPLRERPAAQLMLALYRDGRVPEALEVYRRLRQAMVDELGWSPARTYAGCTGPCSPAIPRWTRRASGGPGMSGRPSCPPTSRRSRRGPPRWRGCAPICWAMAR
ncbi:BTAD domain-containing putative transcriptional regulator [Nonomuraea sp. NPDC049309]|uniref:AfsR/SARP family transcriptional regulator n=1 Tax=Nonomuraea sp. NPDC049309 TaxID=3364350 RepID=UPI0037223B7B